MKVLKLLRRDISMGIFHNWPLFFIPVIAAILQSYECHNIIAYMNETEALTEAGTILDYYLYNRRGMFVFHFNPTESFIIPVYWFIFQIGISYFIGYYSHQDFVQNGRNLFLAVKDRTSWWHSKCVWCIGAVLCNYMSFIFATVLSAVFWGAEWKFSYTNDFVSGILSSGLGNLPVGKLIFISFLVPCIITIGLCFFQILVGFLLTPVVSFAGMCGLYVLSAYYTEWFLPGSYTMWFRSTYATSEGVRPVSGIILGVVLIFGVWYMGKIYFESGDVF